MSYRYQYIVETIDQGWIDHEGYFWGCAAGFHRLVLRDLNVRSSKGWVLVGSQKSGRGLKWQQFGGDAGLSPQQAETLRKIGRDPDNPRCRDRSITFEQAYPNGYNDHPGPRPTPEDYLRSGLGPSPQ